MKKLTLNLQINNPEPEKPRLANILPCIKTTTSSYSKAFVPSRPLTEVRQRKLLIHRLSGEDRQQSASRGTPTVINVKKIQIPKNRIGLNFRKTLLKYERATNMTQTESPDKEN
jgi:hypothetical protein